MEVSEYLREELDRAHILPAKERRPDIVNLDSQVEFRDEQTGKTQEIILVYTLDADIARRRVSILLQLESPFSGFRSIKLFHSTPEPANSAS